VACLFSKNVFFTTQYCITNLNKILGRMTGSKVVPFSFGFYLSISMCMSDQWRCINVIILSWWKPLSDRHHLLCAIFVSIFCCITLFSWEQNLCKKYIARLPFWIVWVLFFLHIYSEENREINDTDPKVYCYHICRNEVSVQYTICGHVLCVWICRETE
jgi:hypothetical protein